MKWVPAIIAYSRGLKKKEISELFATDALSECSCVTGFGGVPLSPFESEDSVYSGVTNLSPDRSPTPTHPLIVTISPPHTLALEWCTLGAL